MKSKDRIIRITFWLLIGFILGITINNYLGNSVSTQTHSSDLMISISSNDIKPKGKICIVIDDFGTDKNYEQYFDLHENLVFAVIPNTTYSNQISQQAEQRDIETIVHMPMETDSYPDSIYSDVILSSGISKQQIEMRLDLAFSDIPNAIGVNNHQGSIATANLQLMKDLARCLKDRKKYFLDSYTNPDSKAFTTMRQYGVKTQIRQVFLDNDAENPSHINNQIDSLLKISKDMEVAIGICHIRPTTYKVLKNRIPRILEEGYEIVRLSEFVH